MYTGAHDQHSPNDAMVQHKRIKKITLHQEYGSTVQFNNDIALVELEEPVRLNVAVNTICLPSFVNFEKPGTQCM